MACFTWPPGSASVLRALPGFASYGESKRCLQGLNAGADAKVAPGAFSLKLRAITGGFGLTPSSCDEEFETCPNLPPANR
eukprot:8760218-Pyramimonas_sp.AAC.1